MLREVIVKIELERIDIQERVTVKTLLDSNVIELVISSELARKYKFKLKKIKRYVKNIDGFFNKEKLIKHTVEVNIYYQWHRVRTEIDVIGSQKWSVFLRMLWLAHHNPEDDWKKREVKMTRYLEECEKQ